ncbi:ATP-binding protein [Helicobacter mustelae]|uniref:Putative predicted ATPase n=1 Tax=Helicobacter mustelae (strain ATCC 43772 / CCUG 25715 / CIP 103759 / LMG 18044 / NCTC 12198 / R85-136P) TaxID=679897 RepID=D3UIJ1_HELM1|nr:ATP-binding protein [Helicobacter mustelae]CBG40314.1 Putative predicted ATPase [Helicobacter mustelae 12198]SQH71813.1 ATPase [Helicobacter mustelae]STP12942.1 ATPase [Helicobacter mustelae]
MQELENILAEKLQNFEIFPRRFGIKPAKIHLYGPPRSGKTSLSLLIAKHSKHPIYIDCIDPRNDKEMLTSQVLKAFLEKRIDWLILDNYDFSLTLPNLPNILLITTPPIARLPQGFLSRVILPLNFAEYISISPKSTSLTQLFNSYLKNGNTPEMLFLPEFQKIQRRQEHLRLFFQEDYVFFLQLLSFQSQKITTHHLYTHMKKSIKISKDKAYRLLNTLEACHFLTLLPHINAPSLPKKLFFYDFALPYAFSKAPNFQAIFENMVFLELLNQTNAPIFYAQECHFLIENHAFFALPFPNQKDINKILQNNPKRQITIIAIHPQEHPHCKIIDFISFALRD